MDKKWAINEVAKIEQNGVKPIINFAEGFDYAFGPNFRGDFASAVVAGTFYGHDEGTTAHRYTFMHDEYEGYLGHPAGPAEEIKSGVWARYFHHGMAMVNASGRAKTVTSAEVTGGPYYRFLGGQDSKFNNGKQFSSVSFEKYDGIMLFKQQTTLVTPIIIDNVARNMTSLGQPAARYTGSWKQIKWTETSSNTAYSLGYGWDEYGSPYAYTKSNGEATYNPNFGVAGKYEVFEWHPDLSADGKGSACQNVRITINSADGTVVKNVNQQQDVGKGNSLGVYSFNQGLSGSVVISAPSGCTRLRMLLVSFIKTIRPLLIALPPIRPLE